MTVDHKKRAKNLTLVVLALVSLSFYLGFIYLVGAR
ncbi:hypothetical protein MNBD_GAMMA22-2030 [hydrothermal vent metagenome]|uniref:Uncharacterized protein n=1 Tax=hydrothermal vent metagenome TaxID=652676 RepID=A0A3B1ANS6_9ZZZZ